VFCPKHTKVEFNFLPAQFANEGGDADAEENEGEVKQESWWEKKKRGLDK